MMEVQVEVVEMLSSVRSQPPCCQLSKFYWLQVVDELDTG